MNVREKILLAAVALTETAPTITTPDLVMRAWSLYPEAFSLAGYAHPHSNAVIAKLSGADGLVGLGWLERTDESAYRVTRAGHAAARRLREGRPSARPVPAPRPPAAPPASLPPPPPVAVLSAESIAAMVRVARVGLPIVQRAHRGASVTLADVRPLWAVGGGPAATGALLEHLVAAGDLPELPTQGQRAALLALHRRHAPAQVSA